ncbi:DUF2809 domain-containing protein [Streptomyces sp. TLI_171]|uniref:ribosomal maturation YjgA family protein n=1 Tax=Streptomyces sp. TLI_171 TaxID=1938859 RepID=UPI000C18B1C2|nr:DUF2809 domain-containing protein [Streptomyces sp. TLI_171]RKE16950.1 uncharacterized protein DUF2809 [Streptomyces sp. TLI_171]
MRTREPHQAQPHPAPEVTDLRAARPQDPARPRYRDPARPGYRARAGWLLAAAAVLGLGLVAPGLAPPAAAALLGGALYTALLHTLLMAAAPRLGPWTAGGAALAASWAVELFQLTGVPADLGAHSRLARLVLGTTFDLSDLPAYLLGAAAVVAVRLALRALVDGASRRGTGPGDGPNGERRTGPGFDAPGGK